MIKYYIVQSLHNFKEFPFNEEKAADIISWDEHNVETDTLMEAIEYLEDNYGTVNKAWEEGFYIVKSTFELIE